jgi:ABC-type amino acid transport substrate-binding protein
MLVYLACVFALLQFTDSQLLRGSVLAPQAPFIYRDANGTYTGFSIDLIDILFNRTGYSLDIQDAPNGGIIGQKFDNETWNGAIGDLNNRLADFIVGPVPVTGQRDEYVDFSRTYLESGIQLMTKRPSSVNSQLNLGSFLNPFSWDVWVTLLLTSFAMALAIYLLDHFSPYGYHSLGGAQKNDLDMRNSIMNSWKIIQNKNPEFGKAWAARWLIVGYGIFASIIVACYIADLAASLTKSINVVQIQGLPDIKNYGLKYSVVRNTPEFDFMHNNQYVADIRTQGLFYGTVDDAVAAVRNGQVDVFVGTNSIIEFYVNQPPCDMVAAGQPFNLQGYAIALQFQSPYLEDLNLELLKMKEEGIVAALLYNWWYARGSCRNTQFPVAKASRSMSMQNVGGVWIMMCVFVALGLISLIIELLFYPFYIATKHKFPFLKYIHRFLGGKKEPSPHDVEIEFSDIKAAINAPGLQTTSPEEVEQEYMYEI